MEERKKKYFVFSQPYSITQAYQSIALSFGIMERL